MSEPVYKIGREIKVVYQAAGAQSGRTIEMNVYDESQALVTGSSVAAVPEIGSTGRYRSSFTPDAEGDWMVQLRDSVSDSGKVVKHYEIGGSDVDSIGDTAGLIKVQTDLLPADPSSQTSIDASISASEAAIIAEIDDLESPAMVG